MLFVRVERGGGVGVSLDVYYISSKIAPRETRAGIHDLILLNSQDS